MQISNEKFIDRSKLALVDAGVKVLDIFIEKEIGNERTFSGERRYNRDILFFKFMCPCGEVRREAVFLPDLWKSKFDQVTNCLRKNIYQHLKEEGLLN